MLFWGLCPLSLKTCLTWRPSEDKGDHNADDCQHGDRVEHRYVTFDEIPQLPAEKISNDGLSAIRGKDEPVDRSAILGATKCDARGRDCELVC